MAVVSFEVENYRSFADRTRVDLRPLTLLFGYNSAGKSALLRLLPILSSAVEPRADGVLNLRRSPAAREAPFNDLRCRLPGARGDAVLFSVSWDDDANPARRIEIEILDLVGLRRQVVERIRVTGSSGVLIEAALELPESETSGSLSRYAILAADTRDVVDLDLDGLVPSLRGKHERLGQVFDWVAERLRSLLTSVHWISSLRRPPPRRVPLLGPVERIRADGKYTADMLAFNPAAAAAVSGWYERATGHRLDILRSVFGNDEQASVVLSHVGAGRLDIPLSDTGEGMAQVFPVVTLASMAMLSQLSDPAPTLAFEQPELHLHPRAHAEVAALFCQLAATSAARVLIETHSENILLRTQLAILRGEISPDRVIVYWVRQLDNGAGVAERITFDDLARPEGDTWPPGVFSEDVAQAREIVIERRRRRQQ